MARRSLSPDERALWSRVVAGVRPLHEDAVAAAPDPQVPAPLDKSSARTMAATRTPLPRAPKPQADPGIGLDASWDRRLRRGTVQPELAIDLHGHTLASAHAELDAGLGHALAGGVRVLLLVTGRPPRGDRGGRGAIRGEVMHWLASSRHAARIAAVRAAHPRHGGAGALYLILRRSREPGG